MVLPLLGANLPPAQFACRLHTLQGLPLLFQLQEALASLKIIDLLNYLGFEITSCANLAAACSASRLLLPTPCGYRTPLKIAIAVKLLS